MLSSAELVALRAAQAATFDQSAVIERKALVLDGGGGSTQTVTTASSPCRIAPEMDAGEEKDVAGRVGLARRWLITFPAETDVRESDAVVVAGVRYQVVSVMGPRSFETARQVRAVRL